jgi:hypothetical protein
MRWSSGYGSGVFTIACGCGYVVVDGSKAWDEKSGVEMVLAVEVPWESDGSSNVKSRSSRSSLLVEVKTGWSEGLGPKSCSS